MLSFDKLNFHTIIIEDNCMLYNARRHLVILVLLAASISCSQLKSHFNYLLFYVGRVDIIKPDKSVSPAEIKKPVFSDDTVKTAANSSAYIQCGSDILIRIWENTEFRMYRLTDRLRSSESKSEFELTAGRAVLTAGKLARDGELKVKTPTCTVAIRGTLFSVSYVNGITSVIVMEGSVVISSPDGKFKDAEINAGQKAAVMGNTITTEKTVQADLDHFMDFKNLKPLPDINSFPKEKIKEYFEKNPEKNSDILPVFGINL